MYQVNDALLRSIVSAPADMNYITAANYDSMNLVKNAVVQTACNAGTSTITTGTRQASATTVTTGTTNCFRHYYTITCHIPRYCVTSDR